MKKSIKTINLLLISAAIAVMAVSCELSSFPGTLFTTHQLTLDGGDHGSVSGTGEFYVGQDITISATPEPGYKFIEWEGDVHAIDGFDASSDEKQSLSMPSEDVTLTARWGQLEIGDIGPAGGWIFYIDEADEHDWTFLEAAPSGWYEGSQDPTAEWGDHGTQIGGDANESGIGYGWAASVAIVSHMDGEGITGTAAQLCEALVIVHNGTIYDDWFLPSIGELDKMNENLHLNSVGDFENQRYWSSTESGGSYAEVRFFGGLAMGRSKNDHWHVRPIRSF